VPQRRSGCSTVLTALSVCRAMRERHLCHCKMYTAQIWARSERHTEAKQKQTTSHKSRRSPAAGLAVGPRGVLCPCMCLGAGHSLGSWVAALGLPLELFGCLLRFRRTALGPCMPLKLPPQWDRQTSCLRPQSSSTESHCSTRKQVICCV
jgi:hypothetical protein